MTENNYDNITEVDLAYQILTDSGKDNPIHYKTLILDILKLKNKPTQNEAAAISEVYTMINMDSRFQHLGKGLWGLVEWNPPETKRTRARSAKVVAQDSEKSAEDSQE